MSKDFGGTVLASTFATSLDMLHAGMLPVDAELHIGIFAKTGTTIQAELARLVANLTSTARGECIEAQASPEWMTTSATSSGDWQAVRWSATGSQMRDAEATRPSLIFRFDETWF